ncbi:2-isopropylmalate synthase [Photobacterium sp. CAU 1568]|uniref:2-isopropylmalate synthase n=1 Tax=Photobacterium arenosum TaxID=2774143 RepID=A0ABR9BM53_9GAMM|nr:2-isopropylmalate synthase [Photobacterium arenosum]MBD8513647.1 2-isopropylmalate synthase [Photobacterium arenosum]
MSEQIIIFDTTLRDGEQALLSSLSVNEKLQIALALERLGVDVMEVGFPVSSPGDFQSVQTIAQQIKNSRVCALARAVVSDIDTAAQALKVADQFRLHTFISTSTIHIEHKLRSNFDSVLQRAVRAIQHARKYTDDVEFSCEDAGRTPLDNLCRMVESAISAGARTINIPDTVGYTTPDEFGGIIKNIFNRVPNIDQAVISVHCHNDLGLAVANSISAIQHGARQIECTMNGIGERAGNCSLEEIAMILKNKEPTLGFLTKIESTEIYRTSQLVSQLCDMPVQPNKAIVGANAFSHSSGIHQDGVLKGKNTYEIMTPESVGLNKNNLNLTSRSGRHVIKHRLSEMGYSEKEYNLENIYQKFLEIADRKGQVFDYDLEALLFQNKKVGFVHEPYQIDFFNIITGLNDKVTATVSLLVKSVMNQYGNQVIETATGNSSIDAIVKCIKQACGYAFEMDDYNVSTKGFDSSKKSQVNISGYYHGRKFYGVGKNEDVVTASVLAMIQIMNSVNHTHTILNLRKPKSVVEYS